MMKPLLMALTIDDGPGVHTRRLLDILGECLATFFLRGDQIGDGSLVREILARGHRVGNHSLTHNLQHTRQADEYVLEIDRVDRQLRDLGATGYIWHRLPYGVVSARDDRLRILKQHSRESVGWAFNSWEPSTLDHLVESASPAIFLFHETIEDLGRIEAMLHVLTPLSPQYLNLDSLPSESFQLDTGFVPERRD